MNKKKKADLISSQSSSTITAIAWQERDPEYQNEKERYDVPIPSREFLRALLAELAVPASFDTLIETLGIIEDELREALRPRLRAMVRDGEILRNRHGEFLLIDETALCVGEVFAQKDGTGIVIDENLGDEIVLSSREMRQVLHGDRVTVRVHLTSEGKKQGKIVEVVARAQWEVVGRYREEAGAGWITPENPYLFSQVLVAREGLLLKSAPQPGQWVVASIVEPPTKVSPAVAKITKILGDTDRPGMEMDVAILAFGLPHHWSEEINQELRPIGTQVHEADKKDRVDLRDLPLVTIDGEDARDFDDAVYCEPLSGARSDGWRLIVAIADVAHYVTADSALDKEALSRGTSVYFPRGVIPMLPEALSNGLCSLNPEVDRLCVACDMHVDKTGRVSHAKFYKAVMRSHARLTYTEAATLLWANDKELRQRRQNILPHLQRLNDVYRALDKARRARGTIDFDFPQMRFEFDKAGEVSAIKAYERNDAHKIIEECMIAANVEAAKFVARQGIPALFRVHEDPSDDRVDELREFLASLNIRLPKVKHIEPKHYLLALKDIRKRDDAEFVELAVLRSMMQAVYCEEDLGHFGLALSHYAHFTSPIRRYPDLLVHRAIEHALAKGTASTYRYSTSRMTVLAKHCSVTERRADDATREAASWLQCQYMQKRLGEEYQGVITQVKNFGIFVRIDSTQIDGLVHVSDLGRDYFYFDESSQRLVGRRTGQTFKLGDKLKVKVTRVDLEEKHIDFSLVGVETRDKKPRSISTDKKGRSEKAHKGGKRKEVKSKRSGKRSHSEGDKKSSRPARDKKRGRAGKRKHS